jgi:hypothetical protein
MRTQNQTQGHSASMSQQYGIIFTHETCDYVTR